MLLRHRLTAFFNPDSALIVRNENCLEPLFLPDTVRQKTVIHNAELSDWPEPKAFEKRLDLAVVCVPAYDLALVLKQLTPYAPRALLLLTHRSSLPYEPALLEQLDHWAAQHYCLVLGPRSFGLMRPWDAVNLSIQPELPLKGKIALVSQSRTVTTAILDWAIDVNVGFSTVVDLGDETDVDMASVLDFLVADKQSESIVLYLHSHPISRDFASALYAAAVVKPVLVLKAAEPDGGAAMRAREEVFSALVRRTGAIRVRYLVQLYAALKILSLKRRLKGSKIALLANGDGIAQLALDVLRHASTVRIAPLSPNTLNALSANALSNDKLHNPIVRYAPWTVDFVEQTVPALMADTQVDGLLVLLAPDPYADLSAVTDALIAQSRKLYKPLMTCLMGDRSMRPLRQRIEQEGLAALRTPDAAVDALNTLASYHYSQQLSRQILPAYSLGRPPDVEAARRLLLDLQQQGVNSLDETYCAQLFTYFYVPIVVQAKPYTVPHLPPTGIHVYTDEQYGPFMAFGAEAGRLELISSRTAVELPPLNRDLASLLIQRAPIWRERLAKGLSDTVFKQLQHALESISTLISELSAIKTIQIDPLWLSPSGLYCSKVHVELHPLDTRSASENRGYQHMAIHPYPRHLVQTHEFIDAKKWVLRPIRPEDALTLQEFIRGLSTESRYMRFVSMMRELSSSMLSRYTRIDYSRELALVATIPQSSNGVADPSTDQIIAFAHYLRNNDGRGAEYALVVGDDWQRHGLGVQLMKALIAEAKQQGLSYIDGYVLATNYGMLGLLKRLGFQNDVDKYDPSLRRVWLDLSQFEHH